MTARKSEYIRQWLEKAEHDLTAAKVLIEVRPLILDVSCFHCQQAVEKFFKAFLVYNGSDIQKTHDIVLLRKRCEEADPDFEQIDLKYLSEYAVEARYPDSFAMPDLEEAMEYLQLALEVRRIVLNKVKL